MWGMELRASDHAGGGRVQCERDCVDGGGVQDDERKWMEKEECGRDDKMMGREMVNSDGGGVHDGRYDDGDGLHENDCADQDDGGREDSMTKRMMGERHKEELIRVDHR